MINGQLERHFVWTAIPAGRVLQETAGPMALVSLLLTPRLRGPGTPRMTVSTFGMQRWPERLAAVEFEAAVGSDAALIPARRVPHMTAEGESISFSLREQLSAWEALFGADTFVRPHEQSSYAGRNLRTFPAADAATAARQAYSGAARRHLEHGGDATDLNPALRASLQSLRATWQAGLPRADVKAVELGSDASALARAYDFYRREDHGDDYHSLPIHPAARVDEREFHDIVAKLADHPLLLRALGLVIDLALPTTAFGDADRLRIIPRWPDPATSPPPPGWTDASHRDICPRTLYEFSGSRFHPHSTGRIRRGMLALAGAGLSPSANPQWEVVPFDVDGAVVRMVGATSGTTSPGDEALPALRSMGFALVQRDRAQMHNERLARSQRLASAQALHDAVLNAEDLLGGYRIDVLDIDTGRWRSLCERRVRYTIGDLSIGQDPRPNGPRGLLEEGYVRPLAASTGAGARDALYIHETVARWDGWSLAVQRPDRVVETGAMPERTPPEPPFESTIEPELGSLPRLRFGRQYRLRARVADHAGGGLHLDEVAHDEERTEVFTHRRFEPVLPPELVPTHEYQDGETHERLLIRSDRDVPAVEYARIHGYRPYDLRHMLAPKSSLELAMQHRFTFDSAIGAEASAETIEQLFEVAKRADRELRDIPGARPVGLETGSDAPKPYIVLPEEGIRLPWLADPMAKAIALHQLSRPLDQVTGLPGQSSGLPEKTLWQGDWHSRLPVAFRVVSANAGCTVTESADRRVVTVALGPAEEVTLDISSCPLVEDVDLFGIAAWLGTGMTPTELKILTEMIASGRHRMITPPRTVTLMHAVQRPRRNPGGLLIAQRQVGETSCVLQTAALDIDTASTVRIDVHARWTDYEDIASAAQPATCDHAVQVGSYDVPHGPLKLPEIRQEFGDTRRRRVTYTITAVSRFQDCFGRVTATDPAACLARGQLHVTDVPSSARPPAPKLLYTVPTFRWEQSLDGGLSLTRLRRGGGLRLFLERPWFASGEDEALGVLVWWPGPLVPIETLHYVSVAGRDPIWDTGAPPTVLTRDEMNAPVVAEALLQECGRALQVLAHKVQFDKEGNRWYADVDLSKIARSSYFPFVRLVLARYQAHSVRAEDRLSPSIRTEPIQLPPHRSLVVTRTPGRATIALDGLGPAGPKPNLVRAEVQVLEAGYAAEAPDEPRSGVAEARVEPESAIAGWTTVFGTSGALGQSLSVDVPTSGHRPIRVLVQEFETHPPRLSDTGSPIEGPGRLIYADTVPLATS